MTDVQRDIEEWRPVVGYEGRYEVSSLGSVRSTPLVRLGGRILRRDVSSLGYPRVCLYSDDGRKRRLLVQRIVLEAFRGQCPEGMEACHGSPDKNDCRLLNLRWDTHRNNHADKLKHGTHLRGSAIGNSKLIPSDVLRIRDLRSSGATYREIARQLSISRSLACAVANGQVWRHV